MFCPECNCRYCDDITEEVEFHRARHDKVVNGLPVLKALHANICWERGKDRIVIVTPLSSVREQEVAEEVTQIARLDMPYDKAAFHAGEPWKETLVHMFLYERENRVVGYGRFERASRVWNWSFEGGVEPKRLLDHPAIWSVASLWVHRAFRREGIAKRLAFEATRELQSDLKTLGWQTPFTSDAEAFLRRLYEKDMLLAK